MLKKNIYISVLTAAAYLIQLTFIHYFEIGGIVPNIMLILVVCAALSEAGLIRAALYGAICGVLLDFSAETLFGINALLCMYTAIICNLASQKLFKGKFIVNILFVFIMSLVYEMTYYALSFSMRESMNVLRDMMAVALPTAIYNAVLAMLLIFVMKKIARLEQ